MVKIIGITKSEKGVMLYYSFKKGGNLFLKSTESKDGFTFDGKSYYTIILDEKNKEDKNNNLKNIQASSQKDGHYMFYNLDGKNSKNLNLALSKDFIRLVKIGKISNLPNLFSVVPMTKFRNRYISYFSDKGIKLAYSGDFKTWKNESEVLLDSRKGFFDDEPLEIGGSFMLPENILLIYYVKKNINGKIRYFAGAASFNKKNPTELIDRTDEPIWQTPDGLHTSDLSPLGCVELNDQLIHYWLLGKDNIFAVATPIPLIKKGQLKNKIFATLKRFKDNPVIKPLAHKPWEARATFNSAAIYEDGKVHFVYRALGDHDLSVLGYATSKDGLHLDERSDEPIYIPREPFETPGQRIYTKFADHYISGGGYGGVEDPRITKVGDHFYMTYVAYDGANPPRVALTSIKVKDFLDKKWDKWQRPKLISSPGMVNKNAVIFPEKINGKYVVFHRIYPNILIDFVDDLKFDNYLKGDYVITPRKGYWDSKKIGAGAPPIKTKDGWLFIYQSVGRDDPGRYKIGAMMLDGEDPTKVLYRSNSPLIAPDMHYENEGHKAGVVYPCGAVVKDRDLLVYYGGADTVTCAAGEDLDTFLTDLKHGQEPRLQKIGGIFN